MNVQIIYCHPSKESYTYQVLQQLKSVLVKEQIEFQISDLYEMNFHAEITEREYNREGLLNLDIPIPLDVQIEHEKIRNADCIIFLYPVWWSDCPAKLKGWFDRVFSVGYAYGYEKSLIKMQKMKMVKYGIALCTAGHPNVFLDEIGISESMRNVMIDDRLGQRFDKKELIILGGTVDLEKVKEGHSTIIKQIGDRIKKQCN